ncbi:MAG: BlaI/MecI/CopY family transcriptional regulator [Armatimonadota bacterium]|nr:BlaI/MecI/CopY family transcriptional regulator [Armatimonadota bacterium]
MNETSLGDLEVEVLGFIAENSPRSVGETAVQFGEPRGLARTTILTVMERLRKKGYLVRIKVNGVYRYSPHEPQSVVLHSLVKQFVRKTLGGSLSPFVAYLVETRDLSDEEVASLRKLVDEMSGDAGQGGEGS